SPHTAGCPRRRRAARRRSRRARRLYALHALLVSFRDVAGVASQPAARSAARFPPGRLRRRATVFPVGDVLARRDDAAGIHRAREITAGRTLIRPNRTRDAGPPRWRI